MELTLMEVDNFEITEATDFAKILGGEDYSCWLKKTFTVSSGLFKYLRGLAISSNWSHRVVDKSCVVRDITIKPVIKYSNIKDIKDKISNTEMDLGKVTYGRYPQDVCSKEIEEILSNFENFNGVNLLEKTGNTFTIDKTDLDASYNKLFEPLELIEYKYNGKYYVKVNANLGKLGICYLSGGRKCYNKETFWIEVKPVVWRIDYTNELLISEKAILAGIQLHRKCLRFNGEFEDTDLYKFMNTYIKKDMFRDAKIEYVNEDKKEKIEENKEFIDVNNKIKSLRKRIDNIRK